MKIIKTSNKSILSPGKIILCLCAVYIVLFIGSCDLINNPKDPDYLDKLYAEIDWANAAKLSVTVAYPGEWGRSPQEGPNNSGDVRLGYKFNVEFTPNSSYGFLEWLAFDSNEYSTNFPGFLADL